MPRFSSKYATFNNLPPDMKALSFTVALMDYKEKHKTLDGFNEYFQEVWIAPYGY